jgi:hypothetical protein
MALPSKTQVLLVAVGLLAIVAAGYYCAENPRGLLDESFGGMGYFITFPGQAVVMGFRGNVHASYGDWRDPLLKIGVSYIVWILPALFVLKSLNRARRNNAE